MVVLFGLFIFFKYYIHWQTDSGLFMIFLIALFLWNLDSRISIVGALACLVSCPILLILFEKNILLLGEEYAEQSAVWAYYFLVIGVTKQIWEFRKEIIEEAKKNEDLDEVIQEVKLKTKQSRTCAKRAINYAKTKTINELIEETKHKQAQQNRNITKQRKMMDIVPPKKRGNESIKS